MTDDVNKRAFIERIQRSRRTWNDLVNEFEPAAREQPGFCGAWSIKDVIAHITWYERAMVRMLKAQSFEESKYWDLSLEERNALIFEENKDLSLETVMETSQQVFTALIEQLEALPEEALNDPAYFPWMPADWKPWQVIASNTYEHYEGHIALAEQKRA
jgi:uncharacterized damage-inducible protein DinB